MKIVCDNWVHILIETSNLNMLLQHWIFEEFTLLKSVKLCRKHIHEK